MPTFLKRFGDERNIDIINWLEQNYPSERWQVQFIERNGVHYIRYDVEDLKIALLLKLKY